MNRTDQSPAGAGLNPEREWLVPSAILTAGLGLAALLLMPIAGYKHIPPYFGHFINWVKVFLFGGSFVAALFLVRRALRGAESPLRELWQNILQHRRSYVMIAAGIMLAGIDMLFFMWIKPEIAALSAFWVDPYLAELDFIVFGTDPWRFFQGMNLEPTAWAYNFLWPTSILVTLLWIFAQPQSVQRSNAILSYFMIWSLFGPIGQLLFSSAGPIFYSRIGLGDRFAEIHANIPWVTDRIADYLWGQYSNNELGLGAGISAMPSLHVAMVAWIILSLLDHKSRATPFALLFALFIWGASVALGWHYASDGLAGILGAIACHRLSRRYVEQFRSSAVPTVELA